MIVALLLRRHGAVAEDRHVLRAGEHGLVDVLRRGLLQRRARTCLGQGAARAGEVVAHARSWCGTARRPGRGRRRRSRRPRRSGSRARGRARRRRRRAASISLVGELTGLASDLGAELLRPASGRCRPGSRRRRRRRRSGVGPSLAALGVEAVAAGAVRRGTASRPRSIACDWTVAAAASALLVGRERGVQRHRSPPARAAAGRRGASGWRRRRESASRATASAACCVGLTWLGSLDQVDRREQADPDDVDEVPVVGHDDGAGRLLVGEALGGVRAAEHEQEGDQAAGDVQAVEAGGQVEDRAVGVGRRA